MENITIMEASLYIGGEILWFMWTKYPFLSEIDCIFRDKQLPRSTNNFGLTYQSSGDQLFIGVS